MNVRKTKMYQEIVDEQIEFFMSEDKWEGMAESFLEMLEKHENKIIAEIEAADGKFAVGSGKGKLLSRGPTKPFGWRIYFEIKEEEIIFHIPRDPRRDPKTYEIALEDFSL